MSTDTYFPIIQLRNQTLIPVIYSRHIKLHLQHAEFFILKFMLILLPLLKDTKITFF